MKKIIIFFLSTIIFLLLSAFTSGCSWIKNRDDASEYNLVVINNGKEGIKSLGYKSNSYSGGVSNADDSLINHGEKIYFYMESNEFSLSLIDKNNNTFNSKKFNVDFTDKTKIYKVSVEENEDFIWEFKLIDK